MDQFQSKYLAHQLKKKNILFDLIKSRHSTRIFSEKPVKQEILDELINSISYCPSSCNRQPIYIKIIDKRDDKDILGGLLVGGVGWIHRAEKILLLFADSKAYKERLVFMPFLDAGVVIYHVYLMSQYLGLKCCFVNPNIKEYNQPFFRVLFGGDIFCGGFGLGYEE